MVVWRQGGCANVALNSPKRLAAIFGVACVAAGALHAGTVEEVAPQRGRAAAQISWTDESGRIRNLSEFAGYPVVVLPMYTRCPSACLLTVAQLKKTLGASTADPTQFRVLLFSIDPTDTPASLAAYRRREACRSVGSSARPTNRTSTRSWNRSAFNRQKPGRNSCIPTCSSSSTRNCASRSGSTAPTTPQAISRPR